jgi:ankyrin repeat protein
MPLLAEIAEGNPASSADEAGVPLIVHCHYYGDVSAMKFLLANGETLERLGPNFDLNGAAFHGHWRLCRFLLDRGADVNLPLPGTGETPLHAALCKPGSPRHTLVLRVLLDYGADPNATCANGAETGGFMRDCRTRGETPLHRAAAFGDAEAIDLLLAAGADVTMRDANGDTPLAWASWHVRPGEILRRLCFPPFRVSAAYDGGQGGMEMFLRGRPHPRGK